MQHNGQARPRRSQQDSTHGNCILIPSMAALTRNHVSLTTRKGKKKRNPEQGCSCVTIFTECSGQKSIILLVQGVAGPAHHKSWSLQDCAADYSLQFVPLCWELLPSALSRCCSFNMWKKQKIRTVPTIPTLVYPNTGGYRAGRTGGLPQAPSFKQPLSSALTVAPFSADSPLLLYSVAGGEKWTEAKWRSQKHQLNSDTHLSLLQQASPTLWTHHLRRRRPTD